MAYIRPEPSRCSNSEVRGLPSLRIETSAALAHISVSYRTDGLSHSPPTMHAHPSTKKTKSSLSQAASLPGPPVNQHSQATNTPASPVNPCDVSSSGPPTKRCITTMSAYRGPPLTQKRPKAPPRPQKARIDVTETPPDDESPSTTATSGTVAGNDPNVIVNNKPNANVESLVVNKPATIVGYSAMQSKRVISCLYGYLQDGQAAKVNASVPCTLCAFDGVMFFRWDLNPTDCVGVLTPRVREWSYWQAEDLHELLEVLQDEDYVVVVAWGVTNLPGLTRIINGQLLPDWPSHSRVLDSYAPKILRGESVGKEKPAYMDY